MFYSKWLIAVILVLLAVAGYAQETHAQGSSFVETKAQASATAKARAAARAQAKATAYANAYSRAYARARTEAEAKVQRLEEQEQHYMDVIGPEGKMKFDNVRRAATFLFSKGRYEEGAAMFTRALEVYNTALKKPFKDFANVAALGTAIQRREKELRVARTMQASADVTATNPDQAETVFLEFLKNTELRSG